jgi:hypothetical protein
MEYRIPECQGNTREGPTSILTNRLLLQAETLASDPESWFWAQLDITPGLLLRLATLHRLLTAHRLLSVHAELEARWRLARNWRVAGFGPVWPETELDLFESGFSLRTVVERREPQGHSATTPQTLCATYLWGSIDEFVDAFMPDHSLGPLDFLEPSLDRYESGIYEQNRRAFAWRAQRWLHESGQAPLRDRAANTEIGAAIWAAK